MDPFWPKSENLPKVDKRHAFKAILGNRNSEPVLNSVGINPESGTLCEA